jgi:hypothetical protein
MDFRHCAIPKCKYLVKMLIKLLFYKTTVFNYPVAALTNGSFVPI